MFDECVIRGRRFVPARFSAPMVGYTHSAFRRLLAELGGCGALWTEMLAARQILSENFRDSPWLRRRPSDGCTVYQLMVRAGDPVDRILGRLGEHGVDAVDLNLACDSISARACEAGSALFENAVALRQVVAECRRHWPGLLTAKVRLGRRAADWQSRFAERLRVLEQAGLDAVVLHPRFFEDKFKRRAHHELLSWAASLTRLPLIANGDLGGPDRVRVLADHLRPACAVMLGRMAVARPWIFASWDVPAPVDLAATWRTMHHHLAEDFPPGPALRRLKMFTKYFAANFVFGHQFNVSILNASSLEDASRCADEFFCGAPATVAEPTLAGR